MSWYLTPHFTGQECNTYHTLLRNVQPLVHPAISNILMASFYAHLTGHLLLKPETSDTTRKLRENCYFRFLNCTGYVLLPSKDQFSSVFHIKRY